jgi:MFS transporter, ACS family, hexuronate transporter
MKRIPGVRWWITGLLFFSTVINYLDRQNLSILARTIQNELRISDLEYSYVVQGFLLAYTLTYIIAGRITDWLGTRWSMALFVGWWSVADMLTSLARSVWSLAGFRFLLGMGEPGNYTAAPKAVSEWFPARERALVIGIYTAGATLGATIAPPLIAWLSARVGWRAVFLCTGSLGLFWLVPWLWFYRRPEEHPQVTDAERAVVLAERLPAASEPPPSWSAALRRHETWLLMLARLITDPVWYFYLFWFPKYLMDARHLTLAQVGRTAWLVYLAADLGCLAGGWFSGALIRRGMPAVRSRLRVMSLAALLLPLSPLIAFTGSPYVAVAIAAVAAFGHLSWQVTLGALVIDVFPKRGVATVFGLVAAGSGFGGMLSTNLVGRAVTYYSYTPVFIAMGFLHPVAFALVSLIGRRKATTADPATAG